MRDWPRSYGDERAIDPLGGVGGAGVGGAGVGGAGVGGAGGVGAGAAARVGNGLSCHARLSGSYFRNEARRTQQAVTRLHQPDRHRPAPIAALDDEIARLTAIRDQFAARTGRAGQNELMTSRAIEREMAPALLAVLGNGTGGVVSLVGEGVDPALVSTQVVTSTGGSGGYVGHNG
jgi:hypothetical protein